MLFNIKVCFVLIEKLFAFIILEVEVTMVNQNLREVGVITCNMAHDASQKIIRSDISSIILSQQRLTEADSSAVGPKLSLAVFLRTMATGFSAELARCSLCHSSDTFEFQPDTILNCVILITTLISNFH